MYEPQATQIANSDTLQYLKLQHLCSNNAGEHAMRSAEEFAMYETEFWQKHSDTPLRMWQTLQEMGAWAAGEAGVTTAAAVERQA